MTVYDCCMFFNENDLYEIRLNSHWNFVDKFIIVEAGETHTGDPKPFNFDHKRFEKYKEKLIYVKFDNFQDEINKYADLLLDEDCIRDRGPSMETDDWIRDHFQANYLYKVLLDIGANDNDLVYISCLDEIINEDSFNRAKKVFEDNPGYYQGLRPVLGFHLNLYVYKFNLLHKHWKDHIAGMITEFENFKKILPTTIRDRGLATHPHIPNGGYHFTFLDNTEGEKVLAKQKSWAHSRDQYFGEKLKYDNQDIYQALNRLFKDYPHKLVPITEDTHPKYIIDNIEKYKSFIYEPLVKNIDHCPVCESKNLIKFPATMDKWTLDRFLRLNPYTPKSQGYIHHCQDCDYGGFSYRFSSSSEKDYYKDYMTGEYLSSRAMAEGDSIIEYAKWYQSDDNLTNCNTLRNSVISQFIDPTSISSILDFGGGTGKMIPSIFNHCEKYVYEVEHKNLENNVKVFNNQKVDFIFCAHTLEHISDIKYTVEQFKEFLKPNGFIYIEVPKDYSKHFHGQYNFYEHINLFTETSLGNVLKLNNFNIFPVQTINYNSLMGDCIAVIGKLN